MSTPWDHPDAGIISERTCTGLPVPQDGDGWKSAIPNPKFQRSSATGTSFDYLKGRSFTNYGVDQQKVQIRNLILTSSPLHKLVRVGRDGSRRKCALIQISEMAVSGHDLSSSRSNQGITPLPDLELLDVRIASSLNKIIQNSYFKKMVSLEGRKAQTADRFLRGRQIAYLIYDYFRVTGVNDSVLDYADLLFSIVLRNNNIQEFHTRWGRNFTDYGAIPTWWYSRKSVQIENTRVWNIEDRIWIVQHRRSKIMRKRSVEEDLKTWNFEARNGKIESNMLVKNPRKLRHVLKGQGECWQWIAIGLCSKGNNCSFRPDTKKRAKPATQPAPSPEHPQSQDVKDSSKAKCPGGRSPSGRINRMPWEDHLKGSCANSSCGNWHSPKCSF